MLNQVVAALGALLAVAVVVRLAAWLFSPALPLLIVLFLMAVVGNRLFGFRRRW